MACVLSHLLKEVEKSLINLELQTTPALTHELLRTKVLSQIAHLAP
jgi:hypothetical protein